MLASTNPSATSPKPSPSMSPSRRTTPWLVRSPSRPDRGANTCAAVTGTSLTCAVCRSVNRTRPSPTPVARIRSVEPCSITSGPLSTSASIRPLPASAAGVHAPPLITQVRP